MQARLLSMLFGRGHRDDDAEDGRELYLCSREARLDKVGAWHRENVLPKLPPLGDPRWVSRQEMADQIVLFTGQQVPVRDGGMTRRLPTVKDESKAHFVAYYASYDWVCLCQLFITIDELAEPLRSVVL